MQALRSILRICLWMPTPKWAITLRSAGRFPCLVRSHFSRSSVLCWDGVLKWKFPRSQLLEQLSRAVGGPVHCCSGGPETVRHLAIVSGGCGSEVAKVAKEGIDTFITGEGPHWSFGLAEELGVNVLYAGHYATETFGVKALARVIEKRFGIPWVFIDHPTGL